MRRFLVVSCSAQQLFDRHGTIDEPRPIDRLRLSDQQPARHIFRRRIDRFDGLRLFEWARDLEHRVCSSLDSFGPLRVDALPGHDALLGLTIIRADRRKQRLRRRVDFRC